MGFLSFLTFAGYGYFDLWHGVATIALLPLFIVGIYRAKNLVKESKPKVSSLPKSGYARLLWLYAYGLLLSGIAILGISVTLVYVPEDLAFMALCGADVDAFSKRLTPVIAHDRSSFGGALLTLGLTLILIFKNLPFTRSLWQTVTLTGLIGFGSALGIHYYIGYTNLVHLGPAWLGLILFLIGAWGTRPTGEDCI